MTPEELRQRLLLVEDHEQEYYQIWTDYQRENGWEEAPEEKRVGLWKDHQERMENRELWFIEHYWGDQVPILGYVFGNTGEQGRSSLIETDKNQTIFPSRGLVTEQSGIQQWMMIQKHTRYKACFPHRHSFLEMNYCYSGTIVNHVNGRTIRMEPGDLLLMEPGCVHKIDVCDEGQILMNLLWFPSAMLKVIEKLIPGECELSRFLLNSLESAPGKMNYLFFQTNKEPKIRENVDELLSEYYDSNRTASEELFESLLRTLFTRLWRLTEEKPELAAYSYMPDSRVSRIITYIKDHCVDCTRESVADHFGYSGSRISNLLTEHLGMSFVKLRNQFRLERIEELLETTDLSVQMIAEQNGFSNQTHFYRQYKEYFGKLPRSEHFDSISGER